MKGNSNCAEDTFHFSIDWIVNQAKYNTSTKIIHHKLCDVI